MAYSSCSQFHIFCLISPFSVLPVFGIKTLLWGQPAKILRRNYAFYTWSSLCKKCLLNGRKQIKMQQTHIKRHTAALTLCIVQPQDIFWHIKRLAASADLDICLITFFFFFPRMAWWKAAILLFALERVLLLNSVMVGSRVCCTFVCACARVRISRLQALCFLVIFPLKECIVSVWCAENWYKNYFKKTKYDTFLTVRSRLYESSHPFIPRMELITWPFTKYRLVHHRLSILCHHHHHHLLCNRLCDRPGLLVYPPEQGHGSVRYRRQRRVRFLINGRKKCIVIEQGAAIVLPGPSSCKSQSQQLKEKIIIMKEKLKTLKPESHKSRNTHLMVHKNLDFKSS